MPNQLLGSERLLQVQEIKLIERAQVGLMFRPFISPIGVRGERDVGSCKHLPHCLSRDDVPARRNLYFHPPISLLNRFFDRARQ
jgi:hypothetical protein